MSASAVVSAGGAERWRRGHPWIHRSDLRAEGAAAPGDIVAVRTERGDPVGQGFWSPASRFGVRMITHDTAPIGEAFWLARLQAALALRRRLAPDADGWRLAHADSDGLPGLIVDRYGDHLVVQAQIPGMERLLPVLVRGLVELLSPRSIMGRNDTHARELEGLPRSSAPLHGDPPDTVEVREAGVRYLADVRSGQKTGAYLDQRENRARAGALCRGRVADLFCYHGSFALHAASRSESVTAVDSSAAALARGRENARVNGLTNIEFVEANVFDFLKTADRAGHRYDAVLLDPPALAKRRADLPAARRAYHEINLRALRILAPGGLLATSSCSSHLSEPMLLEILAEAAAEARRPVRVLERRGAAADHPALLGLPESTYLKCILLEA